MNLQRALRGLRQARRADELARCIRDSSDWPALAAGYLGLAGLTYPRTFSTRHGDSLRLEDLHDLITAWIIFFRREYKVAPSDRVIVDAGANIGAFSLYAARRAPDARIVALEPFPSTAQRLRSTLEANGLTARVLQRPWALGGADGHRRMADVPAPSQSRGVMGEDAVDGFEIETVSLATFFERERLERVDLLKMDIEGSEHQVIANAPKEVLRRIRTLALEYHPNGSKDALFSALGEAGFVVAEDHPVAVNSGVARLEQISAS